MRDGAATTVNSIGAAQSWYSLSSTKSLVSGLRITVTNNGSVAMGTVGISMGVSNTGIVNTVTNLDSSLTAGLLVAGSNIDTYVAGVQEAPANYVAAFTAISSGTTTTTGAVTAVDLNRTGW